MQNIANTVWLDAIDGCGRMAKLLFVEPAGVDDQLPQSQARLEQPALYAPDGRLMAISAVHYENLATGETYTLLGSTPC